MDGIGSWGNGYNKGFGTGVEMAAGFGGVVAGTQAVVDALKSAEDDDAKAVKEVIGTVVVLVGLGLLAHAFATKW
jgi:hypothetical protein